MTGVAILDTICDDAREPAAVTAPGKSKVEQKREVKVNESDEVTNSSTTTWPSTIGPEGDLTTFTALNTGKLVMMIIMISCWLRCSKGRN